MKNIRYIIEDLRWLKVLNSPFKPFSVRCYVGKTAVGIPYFLPRKWVKATPALAKKAALETKNASEAQRAADLKALGDFFEADSKLEEEKAKLARAKQEDKKPPVIKNHPLINPKPDDVVKALLDQFDMSNIFL